MHTWLKTSLAVVLPALLVGVAYGALGRQGAFDDVPPGTRVGGRVVAQGAMPGVWLDDRRGVLEGREVVLRVGDDYRRVALRDIGVTLDVGAVLRELREATEAPLSARVALHRRARAGEIDVPLRFRVDETVARSFIEKLAPEVKRSPVNARLDLMSHQRIDDVPGAELDVDATLAGLRAMTFDEGEVLEVKTKAIRAPFTSEDLVRVDVSKVLSSFETSFSLAGTGAGRAVNIATAAKALDGWVIGPGETFSFNQVVGPRTIERGFTYAPEIVGDEMEMGVGGGTCQVATTLYAASLHGALDIVERVNHGRPSSYVKMGLDATVSWGKVDLRIHNPLPTAVILHAYLPKPTVVRVEVLGAEPVAKVTYTYAINKADDFFRRITLKRSLPPGKMVRHQKGIKGFEVVSKVVTEYNDGRTVERSYFSGYRPVPEVFWVGPGFDEGELPELPEGASRIERRGVPAPTGGASATGDTVPKAPASSEGHG